MTENRATHSPESLDPSDPTSPIASAAPSPSPEASSHRETDENYHAVVAILKPKLRVIRGACGMQWVVQRQDGSSGSVPVWGKKPLAYCSTRQSLLLRLREALLEEHLAKLGFHRPKREKVFDAKRNRLVVRDRVSREALEETEAARARLKRNDVAAFGVDPVAWATIEALPDSIFHPD